MKHLKYIKNKQYREDHPFFWVFLYAFLASVFMTCGLTYSAYQEFLGKAVVTFILMSLLSMLVLAILDYIIEIDTMNSYGKYD